MVLVGKRRFSSRQSGGGLAVIDDSVGRLERRQRIDPSEVLGHRIEAIPNAFLPLAKGVVLGLEGVIGHRIPGGVVKLRTAARSLGEPRRKQWDTRLAGAR